MFVLKTGPAVFCDVDDTLISWENDAEKLKAGNYSIETEWEGKKTTSIVNAKNVEFLKTLSSKGHPVIVWSGGGVAWAEMVVRVLGLESYVDAVLSKPSYYIDDLKDSEHWIGKYKYYDFNGDFTGE